jgi:hypothetical protein
VNEEGTHEVTGKKAIEWCQVNEEGTHEVTGKKATEWSHVNGEGTHEDTVKGHRMVPSELGRHS